MPPAAQPLSIPVHANQLDAVDEVCRSAIGCARGDLGEQLLLLVVTGLLAIVLVAAAVHIREALPLAREERSRTATEQEAFTRFARAVSRLDAPAPAVQLGVGRGATSVVSVSAAPRSRGLDAVRSAYEDTVLAMDQYEEEYGEETLAEEEIEAEWLEIGLAVRVPAGSTRYQYEIRDPEAFMELVREEVDWTHLLTEEEIAQFVWAGALLREALFHSENWVLADPATGEPARPDRSWPGTVASGLEEPLDRVGLS
jgi:hypothetical protein